MIESLTPEQEALQAVYARKGIDAGIDTTPVTDAVIEENLKKVFELVLKKDMPKLVIKDSPKSAWAAVCEHVGENIEYVHPYLDGHLFSYFFAYYDYMHEVLGVEYDCTEAYEALRGILAMGNIYPLDDVVIVSRKPVVVRRRDDEYHCDGGSVVEYADGYKIYMLNGVRVPEWLAMTPANELDPFRFVKIRNVEVRREFVRKIGVERLVMKIGAECIDKQGDYELLLVDLKGETGKWPYLKMKNPSSGVWHMEAVAKECKTVKEALEWRNQSDLEPEQLT